MSASPVTTSDTPGTVAAGSGARAARTAAGAPSPPSADLARVLAVAADVFEASGQHAQAYDFLAAWKAARAGAQLLAAAATAAPTTRVGVAIAAARDAAEIAVRDLNSAGVTDERRARRHAQHMREAAEGARRAAGMLRT